MRSLSLPALLLSAATVTVAVVELSGCGGAATPSIVDGDGEGAGSDAGVTVTTSSKQDASTGGGTTDAGGSTGNGDAGGTTSTGHHPATTPPTKTCSYTPNSDGFFDLMSPQGSYTVRLPANYDKTKPYPVIIVTHGCGDTADNFCTWGPAAYNDDANERENDKQKYIALSVEDVASSCWNLADSGKVLAALDDAASCFYVDQAHVTMGGYSSGAAVAYKVGLASAERFSGILIEDGALADNGSAEATLLANASWKINIAHIAHASDPDYPLSMVQADWKVIEAAGFPLKTYTVAGDHSGTSVDWYGTLDPSITNWTAP